VTLFSRRWTGLTLTLLLAVTGCNVNTALEQVLEARRLSADLLVQFTKAADASNLAVMADTDAASIRYAEDAHQRTAAARKDVDALRPILEQRKFSEELGLLDEFQKRFDEYQVVDRNVLALAIENTNLKAQRLSFTEADEAVDALAAALAGLEPANDSKEAWRARALAAAVVANARQIQALQAPHIAEPDDAAMTRIESEMTTAEANARRDLSSLATQAGPGSKSRIGDANAALDRLLKVNRQIINLSRRNTNVRSLALSLTQKPALAAACEERLQALQTALAKHGYGGKRWP
jgi:hypothetical protein